MTDKEKILAEIEGAKKHYLDREEYDLGWNKALGHIADIIDSLPEEQPRSIIDKLQELTNNALAKETKEGWNEFLDEEPVSENLEEAMKKAADETKLTKAKNGQPFFSEVDFNLGFSNGAQWQKEQGG